VRHPMAGVLPLDSAMQRQRVSLGYRTATAVQSSLLLAGGEQIRGHEFHYSDLAEAPPVGTAAYTLAERDGAPEGYARANVLASYVHLHFGARPDLATRLVERCRAATPL
jgi:cobyrinic acid a,c-diamide synthase